MYGTFRNEELLGAAIKGRREGLVIATKFAMRWDGNTRPAWMAALRTPAAHAKDRLSGSASTRSTCFTSTE